eukprot:jgi/Mesvir1/13884/Mv16018-RA.3
MHMQSNWGRAIFFVLVGAITIVSIFSSRAHATVCQNTQPGGNTDLGCGGALPICDPSVVGGQCVECLDSSGPEQRDDGCNTPSILKYCDDGVSNDADGSAGVCVACYDTQSGNNRDDGCTASVGLCVDLGPNDGDGSSGATCASCLDSSSAGGEDDGCYGDAGTPFCPDGSANDGDYSPGVGPCAACLDTAPGVLPDDGCGNPSYPVCVTGGPSNGGGTGGASCEAMCADTETGGGKDQSCTNAFPICNDGTNDGSFAFNGFCVACLDSAAPGNRDDGCNPPSILKYCNDGVSNDGDGSFGVCVACYDTQAGGARDDGCTASAPICGDLGPSDADGSPGATCASCLDSAGGDTPDLGCTSDAAKPFCPDGSASDGDNSPGAGPCAVCLDSAPGNSADLGCNDVAAPVCVDGGPSDGDFTGGASCKAPCEDSETGGNKDTGCTYAFPICNDGTNNGVNDADGYCVACFDTQAGGARDDGCTPLAPICGDLGPSDADSSPGATCASCLDSAGGVTPDLGCTSDATKPFCPDGAASDGDFSPGAGPCAACLDTSSGIVPDLGCSDPAAPICVDGGPSNGDFGGGASCMEPCVDSATGGDKDTGCTDAFPICNDGTNDGADDTGGFCVACLDSDGPGTRDDGCTSPSTLKYCHDSVSNDGDGSRGVCVACYDTQTDATQDDGCTADAPMCGDLGPSDADGSPGAVCASCVDSEEGATPDLGCTSDAAKPFCPVGTPSNGDFLPGAGPCAACLDSASGGTRDLGCNDGAPICDDGLNDGDFGGGGSCRALLPCTISAVNSNNNYVQSATCKKDLVLEVLVEVLLTECFVTEIDLNGLVNTIVDDYLRNVPRCAVETAVEEVKYGAKRHLLQAVQVTEITVALRIYVDPDDSDTLVKLLKSPNFPPFLANFFNFAVGVVLSVQNIRLKFIILSSATSDPHFVTTHGQKFDFNGEAGKTYCIMTDKTLQVNARFMGAASTTVLPEQGGSPAKPDTRTWMDQLAIMVGRDRVLVDAESSAGTGYTAFAGALTVNGERFTGRMTIPKLPSGATITRQRNRVVITAPNVAVIQVEVVRASFWEHGKGPGKNFLNLQVKEFKSTGDSHGVLGQSFSGNGKASLPEGNATGYETTGIFTADCHFNRFVVN